MSIICSLLPALISPARMESHLRRPLYWPCAQCYTEVHLNAIHPTDLSGEQVTIQIIRSNNIVMANHDHISALPSLDDMLHSLLLIEEGEHEFSGEEEGATELRQRFFPVTRHSTDLNHAANCPLPRPAARTLHDYIEDTSIHGNINFARWSEYESGAHRRLASLIHARPEQIALTASTGDGFM